jgi:hypothetical protein
MRWRGPYSAADIKIARCLAARLPGTARPPAGARPPGPEPVSRPCHVPGSLPVNAHVQPVKIFSRLHLRCHESIRRLISFVSLSTLVSTEYRRLPTSICGYPPSYAHLIHRSRKVARTAAKRVRQGRELSWPHRGLVDHSPCSFPVPALRPLSGPGPRPTCRRARTAVWSGRPHATRPSATGQSDDIWGAAPSDR